uniref:Uncharacterized protein n=1 Tax=Arundo donax TaxID=35708 RepID=A0A0A9GXR1_ARUDO
MLKEYNQCYYHHG